MRLAGLNKAPAPNRRPRAPLRALAEFAYSVCAPPTSPAAVGEAQRWAETVARFWDANFMKQMIALTLLASALFLAGCCTTQHKHASIQWEYKKFNSIEQANEAAADGWVLADCPAYYDSFNQNPVVFYILKRAK